MTSDEEILDKLLKECCSWHVGICQDALRKGMKLAREDSNKKREAHMREVLEKKVTDLDNLLGKLHQKEKEIQKLKEQLLKNCHHNCREAVESETKKLRDALKVLVSSIDKSCENKLISNSGTPVPTRNRDYHDRTCEYHKLTKKAKKALEG